MKLLLTILFIFSSQAFSMKSQEQILDEKICQSFNKNDDLDRMTKKIKTMISNQTNSIWKIKNRHLMGKALNTCEPTKNSKALVLSFSGTGAYNPRSHSLMAKLIKCNSFQKLEKKYQRKSYKVILDVLKEKRSAYTKWSGIDKGLMKEFIVDDQLSPHAQNFDFAAFASEESEMIADPKNINFKAITKVAKEISDSVTGNPSGIKYAQKCLNKYALKSKELGIHPKLIILSHSSGGRSVVKFLEKMKKSKIQADLVLTIDPVKEAHHAIQEVASQYVGALGEYILNPLQESDRKVRVWSRKQPHSLYKTNAKRWVSFYQTDDSKGINLSPAFGIYGSPIKDATNYKISNMGASGHGKICYSTKTLELLKTNILQLLK